MQRNVMILLASFLTITFLGCGNPSGSSAENQESVDDLAALMKSNPEFANANLKEIKDAANNNSDQSQGKFQQSSADDLAGIQPVTEAPVEGKDVKNLDSKVAKEAQTLIDDILDKFDFAQHMRIGFKVMGIRMNEVNETTETLKKHDFGGKFSVSNKRNVPYEKNHRFGKFESHQKSTSSSKFGDAPQMKSMTCEELVNNPWAKLAQDEYERAIKVNKKEIKKKLSGCAKIQGSSFVQCVADFNQLNEQVDKHANCSIKSIAALDQASDGKIGKLVESVQECMENVFSKCEFSEKLRVSKESPTENSL